MVSPIHIEKTVTQVVQQNELERTDDTKSYLESKLKSSLEGKFMKEGFVVEDSLRVKDMSAGQVISESLSGDLSFIVMIEADIIRVQPGTVVKGIISDMNKLGIRIIHEPLDIILAYEQHHNPDALREKSIGDEIEVVIAASKFQIGDVRQSAIALWTSDEHANEYIK